MAAQRRRDTGPEMALRRALHARGHRYRVDATLPVHGLTRRRADLLFTRAKVAVFVDGCFWHACPQHATQPANNAGWWAEKLRKNVARDQETDVTLQANGWTVVRIWEHESTDTAVHLVEAVLLAP